MNYHSQEPEKDAVCVPSVRYALSKPCSFGGVSQFSELSKAKIRKKTGNYLVLIEFIFLPIHHSSFFPLSCDTPILNRTKLSHQKICLYPKQISGTCLWYKTCKLWCSGGNSGASSLSSQAQDSSHALCFCSETEVWMFLCQYSLVFTPFTCSL